MFSRKYHRRTLSWGHDTRARYDTPLDELIASLNRVEELVKKAREAWEEEAQKPAQTPARDLKGMGAKFLSRRTAAKKEDENKASTPEKKPRKFGRPEREAKFIMMNSLEEDELVELLRRIAELVILGEKAVAAAEVRADKIRHRKQNSDGALPKPEKPKDDTASHVAVFELFFERNALALIVNIATGVAFTAPLESSKQELNQDGRDGEKNDANSSGDQPPPSSPESDCTLLPPFSIATQAIQSVSILIQNVSRATSLYFLLSNNLINELIDLPLELYVIAERNTRDSDTPTPRRSGSPEIAELTTHFISFLKSLAMRMNVETLQFFLSYPADSPKGARDRTAASSDVHPPDSSALNDDDHGPMDEVRSYRKKSAVYQPVTVKAVKVEFPLYRRALEFCAAHQDSFVRVTAMNICLNTLRIATVSPSPSNDASNKGRTDRAHGSSPDGVLHNAQPLPLKERLGIAQHVCSPTRVAGLVSPIFTKLAELWGMLEEYFREMESFNEAPRGSGTALEDTMRRRTAKVEKAREVTRRRRVVDSFHDAAASIQDELLMLDDVFKVGLTSLNEQAIEMMMATFVYPLLLQPLLMYVQTVPSTDDSSSRYGMFRDGSAKLSAELTPKGGLRKKLARSNDSAPAQTALFTLASVFHLISNRPLLRLLLTALLNPLSPDANAETIIQARPDVACVGPDGKLNVRVDEVVPDPGLLIGDERRYSYSFGEVTGQRSRMNDTSQSSRGEDICVFVLSPALAYLLEGKGDHLSTIVKTRPNPYRRSMLQCLVGSEVSLHMRDLSMLTIDAAVAKFEGKFLGDLIFGSGMKKHGDEIPMDERRLDSRNAYTDINRGMGGGSNLESRRAFKREPGQAGRLESNPTLDVVTPLCLAVLTASSGLDGSWNLEYNDVAAHALLCTSRSNANALEAAAKLLDLRKRQAAAFLGELALRVDTSDVQSTFLKAPSIEEEDEMRIGMAIDHMFYDPVRQNGRSIIEELLCRFKDRGRLAVQDDYSVAVFLESTFGDLAERACYVSEESQTAEDESSIGIASNSALVLFQLDALSTLMRDLAATNGEALRGRKLAGFAISTSTGAILDTKKFREKNTERSIYVPISKDLFSDLFNQDEGNRPPVSGSVVSLVGHAAFPCVCEVPDVSASLFSDTEASLVAAGVKWQSLYLVIVDRFMILAEPEKEGSGGNGRVVTSCELAQVRVEKDPIPSSGSVSSARRLLIGYIGFDSKPPGMFEISERPIEKFLGPFVHLQVFLSFLDVWFEDERAADQAYSAMSFKIAEAKSKRGNRLRAKFAG